MTSTPGLTVYGCEQDEADVFHELAPRFGVVPTITSDAVPEGGDAARVDEITSRASTAGSPNRPATTRSLASRWR